MLRPILEACRRSYTCSCIIQQTVLHRGLPDVFPAADSIAKVHTSPAWLTMDLDKVKSKKAVIRTAQKAKEDSVSAAEDSAEPSNGLEGLTEAGVMIPSLETHAMLIGGVRYDELPIVHIKASLNNTIITVTDYLGTKHYGRSSCGAEGFKNVKKGTNVAAQATGLSVGNKVYRKGLRHVRIAVQGIGAGRLASLKGLQMAGLKIVSITDTTPIPFNGPRPRKAKRN